MALDSRGEDPGGEGTKCGGAGVSELAASGWGPRLASEMRLLLRVGEGWCQRGPLSESDTRGRALSA